MRKISLIELESICDKQGYKLFSVTNEDSTSFDFTIPFQSIEFYYNTITLKNDAYYLRISDIFCVSVDDSTKDTIRFVLSCVEYLPKRSVKIFTISAKR